MGLQLIFVVETNKRCKSDWIYVKDTVDHFYEYNNAYVKLTPVYMDGKGRYKNKEKEISTFISQYSSTSKNNASIVIFCFDCDDFSSKPDDAAFLEEAQRYCKENGYEFVWFCKDIEQVYLGKQVSDKQKKAESVRFAANKEIKKVEGRKLQFSTYKIGTSNILAILDKYLTRK